MQCAKREFNYGKIFLEIPYSQSLNFFYINILPFLLIYFSIFFVIKIFNIQNYTNLFILIFVIFNPSTFLLYSGANIDLLIFILLIFVVFNKIYFVNWFIYFFLTFVKIYPIILFFNIFFENIKRSIKRISIILIVLLLISLFYFYLNFNEYIYFLNNLSGAKAGYHYLFSLNSSAKILKYLLNYNYIFLLLVTYLIFFYLSFETYKKISLDINKNNNQKINFYSVEFRLFIISSYLSIICYIFFSNFFHREIFLIGTIPLILKFDEIFKNRLFKFFIYLYLVKLLYSYVYSYFNVNDGIQYIDSQRVFSDLFMIIISIKSIIDYFLMIMISALSLYCTSKFYNNLKKSF